jgi:hypothetical protein
VLKPYSGVPRGARIRLHTTPGTSSRIGEPSTWRSWRISGRARPRKTRTVQRDVVARRGDGDLRVPAELGHVQEVADPQGRRAYHSKASAMVVCASRRPNRGRATVESRIVRQPTRA